MINTKYVPKKTGSGELRTPVSFYAYKPNVGPEPGEIEREKLFDCFCEVYSASSKDFEIIASKNTTVKTAVTIRIRDSFGEFYPSTEGYAELHDYRYNSMRFNIVDVRPDLVEQDFITVLLVVTE